MLFHTSEFLVLFLPIVLFLYYFPLLRSIQLYTLAVAGLVFYAANHFEFVLLLILSAFSNAVFSWFAQCSIQYKRRCFWAISGVLFNLSLLGFFKYGKLICSTFFEPVSTGYFLLTLPLPIGISFYTFQGIGLLVDIIRNDHNFFANRPLDLKTHMLHTIFFISFFPHSIAGPIVKAYTFLPQIREKRFRDIEFLHVFKILVLGYFFKTVIADNIQNYTFWIAYPFFLEIGSVQLFVMMIGYSVQIFSDFAGYSLIAIGIAALFGYQLPDNFNFPYISTSFREFWQRWHMSLSSWLKEYLYYSLGGNRRGKIRAYMNLFIVMFLGGLWHGAAWNYLAWGGVHGAILAAERFAFDTQLGKWFGDVISTRFFLIRWGVVFLVVSWAWLFFKLPDFMMAVQYTQVMLTSWLQKGKTIGNFTVIFFCVLYALPIVFYHMGHLYHLTEKKVWFHLEPFVYAVMLFLIFVNGGTSDAFIYFQF